MSVFITHVLTQMDLPAVILAIGWTVWNISRARLLRRAGDTALEKGAKDPQGKAGQEIVKALTSDSEPWYSAILRGRKPDDG